MSTKLSKIANSEIQNLHPGNYTFEGFTGLKLLASKTGTKSWRFHYRDKATQGCKTMTLGRFPAVDQYSVVHLWSTAKQEQRFGRDPQGEIMREITKNVNSPTVKDVYKKWMKLVIEVERKYPKQVAQIMMPNVIAIIGDMRIESVIKRDIDSIFDRLRQRGVDRTQVIVYHLLCKMWEFASYEELLIKENILIRYRKPHVKPPPPTKTLTDEDIVILWKGFDEFTKREYKPIEKFVPHALRILLLTGLHPGELVKARWSDVDIKKQVWTIPAENRKVNFGYVIPISDLCKQEIKALKKITGRSNYLLAGRYKVQSIKQVVQRTLTRLDADQWLPKNLRATFLTALAKCKVGYETRERCMGHRFHNVSERHYLDDSYEFMDEKREAVERLAGHIASIVGLEFVETYDPVIAFLTSHQDQIDPRKIKKFLANIQLNVQPQPHLH